MNLFADDTSIELSVDSIDAGTMPKKAKTCHDKCGDEVNPVDHVYVGLMSVSDTVVKCACIPRDFSKIIGFVANSNYDAFTAKQPEAKENGLYVYSLFRE